MQANIEFGTLRKQNLYLEKRFVNFFHLFMLLQVVTRVYGIGKQAVLKKIKGSEQLRSIGKVFMNNRSTSSEIIKAGEEAFVALHGGTENETLGLLRFRRFTQKVMTANSQVLLHTLPPTSNAAKFHSLRVFHQCQSWIDNSENLDPRQWGWEIISNKLLPIKASLAPASERLLNIIRCGCKSNCDSKRCTCRKHGLDCTVACSDCGGLSCSNSKELIEDLEFDEVYVTYWTIVFS